jgi:hypothetical protein
LSSEFDISVVIGIGQIALAAGLIYATWQLKTSTDALARNEILPRLTIASARHDANKQSLTFSLENTGSGTAYSIKVTAITPTNASLVVGTIRPSNNKDLVVGEASWYSIGGITGEWRDTRFKCQYEDARGHKYSQELTLSRADQDKGDE